MDINEARQIAGESMQYIGARYVPKFYRNSVDPDSIEWDANVPYEPITVVSYRGDSYTSKIPVPATVGNPADNSHYWAKTGQFNSAIAALQTTINNIENVEIPALQSEIDDINNVKMPAIQSEIDDINDVKIPAIQGEIDDINNVKIPVIKSQDSIYKRLNGKKIIVLGDSLSMANGWCELLASKYGCTVANYSVSGSPIAGTSEPISMFNRITNILSENDTCDYFVLQGGANDKNQSVPLGNIWTTGNGDYFGAAIRAIILKVFNKYGGNVKVCAISTMHRYDNVNSLGLSERSYVEFMGLVCSSISVPFFDAWSNCGIDLSGNTGMYDWADKGTAVGNPRNYHLSPAGHAYLVDLYASFIARFMSPNYLPSEPQLFSFTNMANDLTLNDNRSYAEGVTVFGHIDVTATANIAGFTDLVEFPWAAAPTDAGAQFCGIIGDINDGTVSFVYLTARSLRTRLALVSGHRYIIEINYRRR